MRNREVGYSLLRITFGVIFLFFGIGKLIMGVPTFAASMVQQFAGKLPGSLVMAFSYVLPFAELILGLLIVTGVFTALALLLSGLLLLALTFGAVMLGDPTIVIHNLLYAFINFVLLSFVPMNRYSLDHVRGKVPAGDGATVVALAIIVALSTLVFPAHAISGPIVSGDSVQTKTRYVLDANQSKFIAHGLRGGLFWFKGHEHLVAVKSFSGEAEITSGTILPASLTLVAKADSLEETSAVFTQQQKQIINKELREIVFQPEKYPEIRFRSTSITGKKMSNGEYDVKVLGDLTLHGVTRPITIPAKVTVSENDLRASGEFSIDRGDYNVKATSAFHGLVRVRDKVELEFNLLAHRQ